MINKEEAFSNKIKKVNEVLDELESYLNSAKYALFSNTQVTVDRIRMVRAAAPSVSERKLTEGALL